jgi:hypothetical protein
MCNTDSNDNLKYKARTSLTRHTVRLQTLEMPMSVSQLEQKLVGPGLVQLTSSGITISPPD